MHADSGNGYIDIQGVRCYFPEKPSKEFIQNYGLPKKEQKWRRTELPTFRISDIDVWDSTEFKADDEISWEEAVRQETIKTTGCDPTDLDRSGNPRPVLGVEIDIDYSMECLDVFRQQEFDRIFNGHWIYIKGKPYYLPGPYYFFLNFWWCGDCKPEFRYPDLELSYLWEYVRTSPIWLGLIYITIRGTGKSYLSGAFNYHSAITKRESRTGIQSKTDDDAALFFREKVLIPVTKLPEFLRGINRDMFLGDVTKNSTIDFAPPARKNINIKLYNRMKKDALYSFMDYRNSGEKSYDGQSLTFYLGDEIGKTSPAVADVYERWNIVYNSLWRGNKKRGTAFLTSTVSKMSEGGAECKKIWDNSNNGKLNENGRTATGLVRYFRPDIEATYFDEYGFPDIEKSRTYHDAERKSREHDVQALVTYKQQNPRNADEAFWVTANKCVFNAEILLKTKDILLNSGRNFTRKGNFEWEEVDKKVIWVDNDVNPRWEVSWFPDKDETNMVQRNEGSRITFTPKMGHKRRAALDPFQASSLADENKGSNAAGTIRNLFDYNIPEEFCNVPVAVYLFRPPTPQEAIEDFIKGCFFYGCPALIETNKGGLEAHYYMKLRGYKWGMNNNPEDFVIERPESTLKEGQKATDGIYVTEGIIEQYTNAIATDVVKNGWKYKHVSLIDSHLTFDPRKTKVSDLTVADGLCLLACESKIEMISETIEIQDLFRTYNNSGSYSVAAN